MCPLCEEAFRPNFYRRCAACGYDFGGGVRWDVAHDEDSSTRIAWAAAGVVGVMLALVAFFWVILQR